MNDGAYILIGLAVFVIGTFVFHTLRLNGFFDRFKRNKK
jgi:uncharacterized protein YutD